MIQGKACKNTAEELSWDSWFDEDDGVTDDFMIERDQPEEYKEACDEVLLSRGKKRKDRTTVKSENGSSLNFLKKRQASKKNG